MSPRRLFAQAGLAACVAFGGGCPPDDGAAADPEDTAVPSDLPAICVDAPVTTYANFGRGFLTQHCEVCHAATTNDRHDAPETVTFDTEEEAWAQADRILARAAGDAPTMPPQGGVTDDDRYLLEVWLSCGG